MAVDSTQMKRFQFVVKFITTSNSTRPNHSKDKWKKVLLLCWQARQKQWMDYLTNQKINRK